MKDNNPYLQSKLLWNDLYGSVENKLKTSVKINFILAGLLALTIVGLIITAQKSFIKPYPFIIHGDAIITSPKEFQDKNIKDNLAPYFVKQFLIYSRNQTLDNFANKDNIIRAMSLSTGAARKRTENSFYERQKSTENITEINISSILKRSDNTFDIRWQETIRKNTGEKTGGENYLATITYQYGTPSKDELILKNNPLGFYVTQFVLTKEG